MNDQHLGLADWIAILASSVIAGIVSAMGWFTGKERALKSRMNALEARQIKHAEMQSEQKTELAVIHSNQDHMSSRMDEVRELGLSAHRKLDEVLREVKRH